MANQELSCSEASARNVDVKDGCLVRSDRIMNDDIQDKVGVAFVADKMSKRRLRWFEHVKRFEDALVRRCERLDIVGSRRGRGGPKKYW